MLEACCKVTQTSNFNHFSKIFLEENVVVIPNNVRHLINLLIFLLQSYKILIFDLLIFKSFKHKLAVIFSIIHLNLFG